VLAELLLREPWFAGGTDLEVLSKMFAALGTPSEACWPGAADLPGYLPFHPRPAPPLRPQFPGASADALDLLASMCALDPRRRPSASEALRHRFFASGAPPTAPARLPRPISRAANPLMHNAPAPGPAATGAKRGGGENGAADGGDERPAKRAALGDGS